MLEIKDFGKPVKLTVNVKSGEIMHAFLLETIKNNINPEELINLWIKNYLGLYVEKKTVSELYAEYFISNLDKTIYRTDLRGLNLISSNDFKKVFDNIFQEVVTILNHDGYNLEKLHLEGNSKAYKCTRRI